MDRASNCIPDCSESAIGNPMEDLRWVADGNNRPIITGVEMSKIFQARHDRRNLKDKVKEVNEEELPKTIPAKHPHKKPLQPQDHVSPTKKKKVDNTFKRFSEYNQFLNDILVQSNIKEYAQNNSERISKLFKCVMSFGGFYEATANNSWTSIAKTINIPKGEARKEYADYLFQFERYIKLPKSEIKNILKIDPSLLLESDIIEDLNNSEKLLDTKLAIIPQENNLLDLSEFDLSYVKKIGRAHV